MFKKTLAKEKGCIEADLSNQLITTLEQLLPSSKKQPYTLKS
jgi:hypothetical protein